MRAGRQVWLVLALISILGVGQCRALADPQVVYNRNGIPGAVDGKWSWQTPEGSSVWIQYPVNQQGLIPWTPTGFSYSISSNPSNNVISFDERINSNFLDVNRPSITSHTFRSGRELDLQIPNNNYESSVFQVNNQRNNQNDIKTEEYNFQTPPGLSVGTFSDPPMNKFQVPVMDHFPVPQKDKFPLPDMNEFPSPVRDTFPSPVRNTFPSPVRNTFPSPVRDMFPSQVRNTFLSPVRDTFPSPVRNTFSSPVRDTFSSPVRETLSGPIIDKFQDPAIGKFPSLLQVPTESPIEFNTRRFIADVSPNVLPTEIDLENNINNNIDDFNSADRDDHVEDSTEIKPVVRLTSRGRPQRLKLTTRKPTVIRKRVNRPVPRLLQDTSNRQGSIRLTSRGRQQLVG